MSEDYRFHADKLARQYGIPPDLFMRLVGAESSWNQSARSPVGAIGLGQLMPGTAAELGVDPNDPLQNLDGAARYLRQQFDSFGDWRLAAAAYNAGPGNVRKYGGVPPFAETQNYVAKLFGEGGDDYGNALAGLDRPQIDQNALAALMEPQRPQLPQMQGIDPSLFARMT